MLTVRRRGTPAPCRPRRCRRSSRRPCGRRSYRPPPGSSGWRRTSGWSPRRPRRAGSSRSFSAGSWPAGTERQRERRSATAAPPHHARPSRATIARPSPLPVSSTESGSPPLLALARPVSHCLFLGLSLKKAARLLPTPRRGYLSLSLSLSPPSLSPPSLSLSACVSSPPPAPLPLPLALREALLLPPAPLPVSLSPVSLSPVSLSREAPRPLTVVGQR